ncbi:MAG: ribonuclease HI family protein [Aeromicrobium sp.]|nr:ribonuclease HI family protein [Aeromicrobium sp.]
MSDAWVVNTDGGARGNPGPGGVGIVVRSPDGVVACQGGAFLGTVTNNVAEYEAVIWGLRAARALGAQTVELRSDSELVVRQLTGVYRVKNQGLLPLFREAQRLIGLLSHVDIIHVRRELNREADALANEAMDARETVGDAPEPPCGAPDTLFGD